MSEDEKTKKVIKEFLEILPRVNWYSLIISGDLFITVKAAFKSIFWGIAYLLFVIVPRALTGKTDWKK